MQINYYKVKSQFLELLFLSLLILLIFNFLIFMLDFIVFIFFFLSFSCKLSPVDNRHRGHTKHKSQNTDCCGPWVQSTGQIRMCENVTR